MSEQNGQQAHYQALLEFCRDCCHPEGYGHALPVEVVRRAARLVGEAKERAETG